MEIMVRKKKLLLFVMISAVLLFTSAVLSIVIGARSIPLSDIFDMI